MKSYTLTRALSAAAVAALLATAGGCATAGSTFRSGVGDKFLEHPPWYAGKADSLAGGRIAHLPVAYQRGATQAPMFDPKAGAGTPVAALLAEMNAYLDSLGGTTRLQVDRAPAGTAPDVMFGCQQDPADDCDERNPDETLGRKGTYMRLAVGRPSAEWIGDVRALLEKANAPATLAITLEVGQYFVRQEGILGKKVIELGTNNRQELAWLTSLETPVSVVQLTGALVDRDGKAHRIGAEGILARRTSLTLSSIGAQALITDEEIEKVRTMRREDLPDAPLAWKVAMRELVRQLAGPVEP